MWLHNGWRSEGLEAATGLRPAVQHALQSPCTAKRLRLHCFHCVVCGFVQVLSAPMLSVLKLLELVEPPPVLPTGSGRAHAERCQQGGGGGGGGRLVLAHPPAALQGAPPRQEPVWLTLTNLWL